MERPWLKAWPEGVPKTLEYPDIPLDGLLTEAARHYPNRDALVFFRRRTSYRDLDAAATRFAAGLANLGVAKGDRVVLQLPNVPHYPVAFFGALRAGACVVQANPLYTDRELEALIKATRAKAIISLDIFWRSLEPLPLGGLLESVIIGDVAEALPLPLRILYPIKKRREGRAFKIPHQPWIHRFDDVVRGSPTEKARPAINPGEDIAVLQSTGGTTGTPKQAMLTHRNLVANTLQTAAWFANARPGQEVFLSIIPFFHVYGLTVALLTATHLGATMVLYPDPRDLDHVLKLIARYRPTIFPGVPTLYNALNHHPRVGRFDVKSIRACISGSAPLPAGVRRDFEALTGGRLVEGYGLSEASPVTHCNPLTGKAKDGTIGLPFPDTDSRLVDLEVGEREVGPGEPGELCVRGPQVMKGYWAQPDETDLVLREGWLHTGDIATMDEEGYFTLIDRKKDMINAGGYKVYPREIEEVLYEHPAVKEAAAFGAPDEYRGETVAAVVVLRQGFEANAPEIIAFCRERLAPFKVPRSVQFVGELPKNLVGKVLRRTLRQESRPRGEGL